MRLDNITETEAWLFCLAVVTFMLLALIMEYVKHKIRMAQYLSANKECHKAMEYMRKLKK